MKTNCAVLFFSIGTLPHAKMAFHLLRNYVHVVGLSKIHFQPTDVHLPQNGNVVPNQPNSKLTKTCNKLQQVCSQTSRSLEWLHSSSRKPTDITMRCIWHQSGHCFKPSILHHNSKWLCPDTQPQFSTSSHTYFSILTTHSATGSKPASSPFELNSESHIIHTSTPPALTLTHQQTGLPT